MACGCCLFFALDECYGRNTLIIAQIYVNQLNIQVDRPFDYQVPLHLECHVAAGVRVMIPFGFGNKILDGLVWRVIQTKEAPQTTLKEILAVVEGFPPLEDWQLEVCHFVQQYNHSLFMDVANAYYPGPLNIRKRKGEGGTVRYQIGAAEKERFHYVLTPLWAQVTLEELLKNFRPNARVQRGILTLVHEHKGDPEEFRSLGASVQSSLKALLDQGYLEKKRSNDPQVSTRIATDSSDTQWVQGGTVPVLTPDQERIMKDFLESHHQTHLLFGVTGSGKTELYLRMMEWSLRQNKTCLYLVPEISLTPQTIQRVQERFPGEIAVIHSRIPDQERLKLHEKIARKEVSIIVGARSAILSPFRDLGLIVIDEEHENTYKSGNRPRFDTLSLAQEIAGHHKSKVVLGSATPSVQTYQKALEGKYALHVLSQRATGQSMPTTQIVDMRTELQSGNRSFLSRTLYSKLKDTLARKEQAILFLNKRGYFSYVFCRDCGTVIKCQNCDVTMTYHSSDNRLECHYCKSVQSVQSHCPSCGSEKLKYSGSGTERMQALLQKYFPQARILRMDTDSMRKKEAITDAMNAFSAGDADILLGTQMVTKGFHLENVTLVGVLLADLTLNFPDFRSGERTFQLITQVAGRAGRGDKEGQVIIQTYEPDHYAIQKAKDHDFPGFFHIELEYRKKNKYPPFSTLLYVGFSGNDEEEVKEECTKFHRLIADSVKQVRESLVLDLYPPSKSHITRVNNKYRYYILIKTEDADPFHRVLHEIQRSRTLKTMKSQIFVDVDPNFIF